MFQIANLSVKLSERQMTDFSCHGITKLCHREPRVYQGNMKKGNPLLQSRRRTFYFGTSRRSESRGHGSAEFPFSFVAQKFTHLHKTLTWDRNTMGVNSCGERLLENPSLWIRQLRSVSQPTEVAIGGDSSGQVRTALS